MNCAGWINIYRSGFFHTAGKPGAYDRHPGDIYATEADARADISPASHYVATVPVSWQEAVVPPVNPRVNEELEIPLEWLEDGGGNGSYLWLDSVPDAPICQS